MSEKKRRRQIELRSGETDVDLCPCGSGFLLCIGSVTICLDRAAAEDIFILLEDALLSSRSGNSFVGDSN